MKGNLEGSKDADVGFELNVKSTEMLDEGQKCGGVGRGGVALCLRAPTLLSYYFFFLEITITLNLVFVDKILF